MSRPLRLLHLEDSAWDAEILHDKLRTSGVAADIVVVNNRQAFEDAVAHDTFDLIVCDYNLPGYDGITAVKLVQRHRPETPVIFVSGSLGEEEAVKCLHVGATDYLLKDHLERLPAAVERAIDEAQQRRRRHETEAKLHESEERFRQLAEQSSQGFWFVAVDPERILYVSPAVERIWGIPAEKLYQDSRLWMGAVHPDDQPRMREAWETWAKDETPVFDEECRVVQPDGTVRWVMTRGTQIRDESGAIIRLSGVTQDVSERKALETQFRQAQKMEVVGQLAGGIAHDFNNLLTVINGTVELALMQVRDGDPLREDLQEIRRAGERAAGLTRQLLAFSRKQILQPRVLDLNAVITDMKSMLGRLLGEDVELAFVPSEKLGLVKTDPGQMEQVVTNLAVNARDAMPRGGKLTIETRNIAIDEQYARHHGVAVTPGPYVMMAVSDTGVGMDDETRRRIFEPFFTTKGPDKGTGLGLSTVYGIVKQSDGFVWVYSEVGRGTAFRIYLPEVTSAATSKRLARPTASAASQGTETVLVVEDVSGLRHLTQRILESAGYTVLTAADGEEALALLQRHTPVHLMITDVVMPGMSGRNLAEHFNHARQRLKVLYMSGYTDDVVVRHGVLEEGMPFLGKPFTTVELLRKVREVLDSEG